MVITGVLNLKPQNDDYTVFSGGRTTNISEYLNVMLLSDVFVEVKDIYSKKILFSQKGKLVKQKLSRCYYLYHVDKSDLDSVLWNHVGRRLEIELKNIS